MAPPLRDAAASDGEISPLGEKRGASQYVTSVVAMISGVQAS